MFAHGDGELVVAEFVRLPTLHIGDKCLWRTEGELEYWSDLYTDSIIVPDDFQTDLASIPPFVPEWLIQRNGKHRKAAIVHDFLCRLEGFPRRLADRIFLEAMAVSGEARWRRVAMYSAVSLMTGWIKLRGKA